MLVGNFRFLYFCWCLLFNLLHNCRLVICVVTPSPDFIHIYVVQYFFSQFFLFVGRNSAVWLQHWGSGWEEYFFVISWYFLPAFLLHWIVLCVVMLFDILLATFSFMFFFSERIASVLKSRPLKRRADIRFSFVLVWLAFLPSHCNFHSFPVTLQENFRTSHKLSRHIRPRQRRPTHLRQSPPQHRPPKRRLRLLCRRIILLFPRRGELSNHRRISS